MKYIDAELLLKEVKRLEKATHKAALSCADSETRKFHEGKEFAYQLVGILIESLPYKQQPDFQTTDKQVKEFLATNPKIKVPEKYKNPDWLLKRQEQSEKDCHVLGRGHDLKILPKYFQAIKSGEKTFEVRYNDRNFQKGDVLHLREWDGNGYTGESIFVEVTYILNDPGYCKEGYVIMAISKL